VVKLSNFALQAINNGHYEENIAAPISARNLYMIRDEIRTTFG
jgi:hypothetical protein